MSERYSIKAHLSKLALLAGLSRLQVEEFSARLQPRRYQGGSPIYYEGHSGNELYFIERGQVEHWAATLAGSILLETLGPGDFFGETAFLSGKGHLITAYAIVDADIWALTKADFDHFLWRNPNLAAPFTRLLGERLERTMQPLSGIAPQRGLPAPTDPVNPSRPVMMPPVRVRRVSSGYDSRARQPITTRCRARTRVQKTENETCARRHLPALLPNPSPPQNQIGPGLSMIEPGSKGRQSREHWCLKRRFKFYSLPPGVMKQRPSFRSPGRRCLAPFQIVGGSESAATFRFGLPN